jgi:hypothetical protein
MDAYQLVKQTFVIALYYTPKSNYVYLKTCLSINLGNRYLAGNPLECIPPVTWFSYSTPDTDFSLPTCSTPVRNPILTFLPSLCNESIAAAAFLIHLHI